MDANQAILQLIPKLQAEQKAQQQVYQADTKAAVEEKQKAVEVQQQNLGIAAQAQAADTQAVADGVANITAQLSADPTDPSSLMARNNAAINQLNEKLLNQYNAINNVQSGTDITSILNQHINLPAMLRGVDQLNTQRDQFVSANTQLQQQLNNQTLQLKSSVELADTGKAIAEQTAAAAKAQADIAKDKLMTASDLYRIQSQASTDQVQLATVAARAQQDALMFPLQKAMAENTIAKFKDEQATDMLMQNALGLDAGKFRAIKIMLQNDPQAYNAVAHFAISGTLATPQDAKLIKMWQNRSNLTNPDGSIKPAMAILDEATRPVIDARVTALYQGFVASKTGTLPTAAQELQVAKMMNNPSMFREEFQKYQEGLVAKGGKIPADAAMNPAVVYDRVPQLAAQTPLIKEVINNSNDKVSDIQPDNLLQIVVKGNMNVPDAKIAEQFATYYQNVLAFDKTRPVYPAMGLAPPNSVNVPVNRMSTLTRFLQPAFPAVREGATRSAEIDFTNQAALTDYISEIKQHATLQIAHATPK